MKAYHKVKTVIQVYLDNNSQSVYMEIIDANLNTVKQCIHDLKSIYQSSYNYYLLRENFESALIIKRKLNRLQQLSNNL